MFPEYSKKYESGYRSFFTIWVVIWTVFNIGQFLVNLINYEAIAGNSTKVGQWLFNSMGSFIGLALGILLLFILNSVPDVVNKKKVITTSGLIMILGVVYFLFPTFISIFGNSVFEPREFIKWFPFTIVWLMPSLLIMGLHIVYSLNLNKYNETLSTQE